ncbi:Adenine phosphoribosyltransferase [hydrothermal vent metagenome]|uniref:adenine phosphoribosyltransferase n=1 Tax=hydrothermal vent metagenome TaxID=652676 RepID=A0A3B1CQL4_9ZZZZ|nr:adenine phosphoribosyltransferase [Candidatus Manganitrophaceae bacterium]
MDLKSKIRAVPDFPKPGILFYDITTLLADPEAFRVVIDRLAAPYAKQKIDKIVGIESRGFIFGAPLAERLSIGFVPVRKPGKLPADFIEESYDLEYGSNTLCIHKDAVSSGERVLVIDDLLATGGTMAATAKLIQRLEGEIVALACVIELLFLNGREKLKSHPVFSVLTYD